jgi:hypothetical protein
MASSSRPPAQPLQRRGPAIATQAKNILSVEEWEAKASLSDLEIRSINLIKTASEKTPLPVKVGSLVSSILPSLALISSSSAQTTQGHLARLHPVRLSVTGFTPGLKLHGRERRYLILRVRR